MKNKMPAQGWSALGGKKVMVFGTFDIFHEGHKDFFRQAREFGEYLIAVIARDKNVLKTKGKLPENNEIARQQKIVEFGLLGNPVSKDYLETGFPSVVILGDLDNKYKVIQEYKPDVICVGYDQKFSMEELKEKLIEFGLNKTQIVRLNSFHPEIYKSSKLRK